MQDDHWPEQKLGNVQLEGDREVRQPGSPSPPALPRPQPDSFYLSDHVVVQNEEQQG